MRLLTSSTFVSQIVVVTALILQEARLLFHLQYSSSQFQFNKQEKLNN